MLKRLGTLLVVVSACVIGIGGCSAETQQEANEALEETGEVFDSAADDTVEATEGAVEGASEAVEEN